MTNEDLKHALEIAERCLRHICLPKTPLCCLKAHVEGQLDNHYHQQAADALDLIAEIKVAREGGGE